LVPIIAASQSDQLSQPNPHFWRARAGLEVDFTADFEDHLVPMELKSGATFVSERFSSPERWSEPAGTAAHAQDVERQQLGPTRTTPRLSNRRSRLLVLKVA
jgi:hypothetical protein